LTIVYDQLQMRGNRRVHMDTLMYTDIRWSRAIMRLYIYKQLYKEVVSFLS